MDQIYLNNASCAYPLAPGVYEAVMHSLKNIPRISGRDTKRAHDSIGQCRTKLAQLLNCASDEIVLTSGATYGLNTAIHGLSLNRSELVITSVMEHNSVLRPLVHLEKQAGIKVKYISLDNTAKLDEIMYERLLKEKPRLVALTHASNVTGRINPIRRFFEKAKASGALTLLDASQTAGRIPVKPDELCADIIVFTGHKGFRAPMGTGVLYINKKIDIQPTFTGGTGIKSDLLAHPAKMPLRLEAGTANMPAFAGLNAALDYYNEHMAEIAATEAKISERLFNGLTAIPNITVYDHDISNRLPVLSFSAKGMNSETVGFALNESFGIECREGLHCAPLMHKGLGIKGTVRFSPSYVNSMDDIGCAIDAVKKITARE